MSTFQFVAGSFGDLFYFFAPEEIRKQFGRATHFGSGQLFATHADDQETDDDDEWDNDEDWADGDDEIEDYSHPRIKARFDDENGDDQEEQPRAPKKGHRHSGFERRRRGHQWLDDDEN